MTLKEYILGIKDPRWFAEHFFKVVPRTGGAPIPVRFKPSQIEFWKNHTQRDIIGKSRSVYISSGVEMLFLAICLTSQGVKVALTAQNEDYAKIHKGFVEALYDSIEDFKIVNGHPVPILLDDGYEKPPKPKLGENSAFKMTWPETGSQFIFGSAGSTGFGHGQPIHLYHATEVPMWEPDNDAEAIISAVESVNALWIVIEGKARGEGNRFHRRFMAAWNGESEYKAHFFSWFWDKDSPDCQIPEGSEMALPADRGPIIPTEEEAALMIREKLNIDNIRWRRVQASKPLFLQERAEDPLTMFMTTGQPVFNLYDAERLVKRIYNPTMLEDSECLKIWLPPAPGGQYLVWADPSGGLPSGHHAVTVVCRLNPFSHVATLRGHWEAGIHGHKSVALAKRYNNAILGWERNNTGSGFAEAVMNVAHYDKVYKYRDDTRIGDFTSQPGFPVNSRTKPMLRDLFAELLSEQEPGGLITYSGNLVAEIRGWRYRGAEMEPQPGGSDDELMAIMEANYARHKLPASAFGQRRIQTVYVGHAGVGIR